MQIYLFSFMRHFEEENFSTKNQELTSTHTSHLVDSTFSQDHLQHSSVASSQKISFGLMEFSNFIRYAW
jgi:hypothetical protein